MSAAHKLLAARSSQAAYPKEDAEQRAVIDWAQWIPVSGERIRPGRKLVEFLIHIPNGGKRQLVEAAIFRALGVRAGVSDLLLALPLHGYAGLWLEMKRVRAAYRFPSAVKNAVSANQRGWIDLMSEAGYATAVAYGAAEAIDVINGYLGGRTDAAGSSARRCG